MVEDHPQVDLNKEQEIVMSDQRTLESGEVSRRRLIISTLQEVLGRLFSREAAEIDIDTPLINLGADSLFLLQASQSIQKEFSVKVPFRLLLEDLSTVSALAMHLDERLPAEFATAQFAPGLSAGVPQSPPHVETETRREIMPNVAVAQGMTATTESKQTFEDRSVIQARALETPAPSEVSNIAPDGLIQRIIAQQLQISAGQLELMAQQLELLRNGDTDDGRSGLPDLAQRTASQQTHQVVGDNTYAAPTQARAIAAEESAASGAMPVTEATAQEVSTAKPQTFEPDTWVAFQPFKKKSATTLSERQSKHLAELIARFTRRTKESKRLAEAYRPFLADSRGVTGFRMPWKEMVYLITIERGQGSHIWDVDGNEYIDLNMGFGALLFGHSPSFIIEPLKQQLENGIQLGPQAQLAGKAAQLICELTGVERAAFCNSGTEAVMTALRLARAVTGRTKIALFEGCYHGTFDGVLVRGDLTPDGHLRALPLAPGVPQHMIENILMLKYDSQESLEILKAHAHELAAVLIEPPRSRRPDVQPKAFLQELRKITREAGAALIFDEVVTGFRFHPGGAQALFDVQADLVTYGKAVGGGLPVAVIAGRAEYMDAVDGGQWHYGDASYPAADVTYFTGTYFKHPMIMPALWSSLNHIKERGLRLQEELDAKTTYIVNELAAYLEKTQTPMRMARLGSLFRFLYPGDLKYIDLFYYHLLEKGIYLSETRNCFLSTAHTDEDLEQIIRIVKESVEEMRAGGFLPGVTSSAAADSANSNSSARKSSDVSTYLPSEHREPGASAISSAANAGSDANQNVQVPLTESQKQLWTLAHLSDEGARAYNQSVTLLLHGPLNLSAMRSALQQIVDRHEILRTTFNADGDYQQIAPSLGINLPLIDFAHLELPERQSQLGEWLAEEAQQTFDFVHGPLLKAFMLELEEQEHVLVITTHHIISDGWSFGALLGELKELYGAECKGEPSQLRRPRRFSEYARLKAEEQQGREMDQDEIYWLAQFASAVPVLELPNDHARLPVRTFSGAQQRLIMQASLKDDLKQLSARQNCTLFMLLFGAFNLLLHHLTGQNDLVVGIPSAGQTSTDAGYLIGYCVNLLPLRSRLGGDMAFTEYLASLKDTMADAYDHQDYPYSKLLKKLNLSHAPGRSPLVEAVFNLDRSGPDPSFYGLQVEVAGNHNHASKFDVTFDVTETETGLVLDCEYNTDLFDRHTTRLWMEHYESILRAIAERPAIRLDEMRALLQAAERQQQDTQVRELREAQVKKLSSSKRQVVSLS
jgi:glutamate-1-semialdehyde aminotransferase/acyl carrier protein